MSVTGRRRCCGSTTSSSPSPKENEIRIKIHATSVTRTDIGLRAGKPFIIRFFFGLLRPKRPILGTELAGEVDAAGRGVTQFVVGDHVFGSTPNFRTGAYAEYICLEESAPIAHKPARMTFEEAAAVTDGMILALMCLEAANVREAKRIVVYGASGAIGTAGVQLARHFGADVTAVCTTKNVELVKSLGADRVIDYTKEDFTKNGEPTTSFSTPWASTRSAGAKGH